MSYRLPLIAFVVCVPCLSSPVNCTALGEHLCSVDGNCAAFGTYQSMIQLHGCVSFVSITCCRELRVHSSARPLCAISQVANTDWVIFIRNTSTGSYEQHEGTINIDESSCASHPNTGSEHDCILPSPVPLLPSPTPLPYTNVGSFDAGTGESSIQWWGPGGRLIIMESIFCGYWDHAGQYDNAFTGHSYFRIRDFASGVVITNISQSIGFGFGSAYVDHEAQVFWVFGTPNDRCGHPVMNSTAGVYAFWSTDLVTWTRSRTDVNWSGPNTDVGRVYNSPPGLPPHRLVQL